jgi:hypothetical protein
MRQIADWLKQLGLGQYAQRFAENDINFAILPHLTDQDLKEIGVASLGHRRQLLFAIAELNGVDKGAVEPAAPHDTAERRQVTVMFSDSLVGASSSGPSNARFLIRLILGRLCGIRPEIIGQARRHIFRYTINPNPLCKSNQCARQCGVLSNVNVFTISKPRFHLLRQDSSRSKAADQLQPGAHVLAARFFRGTTTISDEPQTSDRILQKYCRTGATAAACRPFAHKSSPVCSQ